MIDLVGAGANMRGMPKLTSLCLAFFAFAVIGSSAVQAAASSGSMDLLLRPETPTVVAMPGVQIRQMPGKLRVEINGELFTEYIYEGANRPYLYPIIGPKGLAMTRNWPMKDAPGEEHDHPHHRSIWIAHFDINKVDFWTDPSGKGRTVHDKFIEMKSGPDAGVIHAMNKLVLTNGTQIGGEETKITIHNVPGARLMDFEITLHASNGAIVMGDNKDGFFAIRLADSMRLTRPASQPVGVGHIVNSEGIRDAQAWGKRASWVDYYGPVEGNIVGVAMFDNPANPRYPTWWHVRDYGLFAANPFGIHDFESKPAGTGDMTIAAGSSVTFKYRVYLHEGDEVQGKVKERFEEYAKTTKPQP